MRYEILIWIFLFEVVGLFSLLVMISIHRLLFFWGKHIREKRKRKLSAFFIQCIEQQVSDWTVGFAGKKRWRRELLEILEVFNARFSGSDWQERKSALAEKYLLPKARKWVTSLFWTKRNLAARSFAIVPLPKDEKMILRLMNDRKFLVRNRATTAAIELESVDGIRNALSMMMREPGYSRCFYRDALLRCSPMAASHMISIGKEPAIHEACLDVLNAKSWGLPIPFLSQDLQSKDPIIHRLSIGVLIRNPLVNTVDILVNALEDPEESIRVQAAKGLAIYSPLLHLECLERALSDASWFVRIEAARALKQAGDEGEKILRQPKDVAAKEAVQYVEQFG